MIRIVKPAIRFARWAFGPPAPGFDLGLSIFSGGWALTALLAPDVFEQRSYAVLAVVPVWVFAAGMAALGVLHAHNALRPTRAGLRQAALFTSSFMWLSIAMGFALAGGWTAFVTYGVIGCGCALGTLYVEAERFA